MVKIARHENLRAVVAENVRRLKTHLGISQEAIAKEAKVSQSSVGRVLNGSTAADLDTLAGIARALRVSAWQLLVPDIQPDNLPVLRAVSPQEEALYEKMRTMAPSSPRFRGSPSSERGRSPDCGSCPGRVRPACRSYPIVWLDRNGIPLGDARRYYHGDLAISRGLRGICRARYSVGNRRVQRGLAKKISPPPNQKRLTG
jgi:transcriptional regulator with XRE-family HTH domain